MEWREAIVRAVLALGLCASMSCGGDDEGNGNEGGSKQPDRGDIEVAFEAPPDRETELLAEALQDGFEDVAEGLNETFAFPRDLPVTHERCGEANAFYDPETGKLTMCYELLSVIHAWARNSTGTDEDFGERVAGTWFFVFFHELGHGLVDLFDLPITGREEDSVDNLATVLLVESGQAFAALRAAEFWDSLPVGELDFADEHSLNQQRFFNILCLVYGSDPKAYAGLVRPDLLPESRALRCPAEYESQRRAWDTLLEPYSK